MSARAICGCGREYTVPPWPIGPRCLRRAVARSLAKRLPPLPPREQPVPFSPCVAPATERSYHYPDAEKAIEQAIVEDRYDVGPCRSSIPVVIGKEPGINEVDSFTVELVPSENFVGYSEEEAAVFWEWLYEHGWVSADD